METVREFMDNPRFPGIPCERCGLVSLSKFQSCEHRPGGACPYVLRERALRPASLPGILMIVMGALFLLAFGSMPFLLYPKEDADLGSLIAGILVLTFAFTIANIFVLVGAAFAGLRKSLFHNKAQSRYVETYTIFGLPLAHRLITLGEAVPLEVRVPPLPLSLAGFLMDRPLPVIPSTDLEAPPLEIESKALNRLKSINAQLDQGIANALVGAVVHLVARSCVVFRSASHGIFSRWYTTPSLDIYYIEAGEGRSDDLGLLEADLLNKVLNWRSQEWKVEDTVAPTFPDLIKTFQDSDGDFSAYQIRKLLLTDGEPRRVFSKRSEGLLGKLMPKIEPTAEAEADKRSPGSARRRCQAPVP